MSRGAPPRNVRRDGQRPEPSRSGAGAAEPPRAEESPNPPATRGRSVRPEPVGPGAEPEATRAPSPPRPPFRERFPRVVRALGAARLLVGIAVVAGASLGVAWGAKRYVTSSPRFAVRTVVVDGADRLTPQDVAVEGGIAVGDNVFSIDLDQARQKIERHPWVASARVTRKLPGSVMVSVVEHEPRALVSIDEKLYLVDRDGEVFKETAPEDPFDLPLVTGIEGEKIVRDREGVQKKLRELLGLVEDLERAAVGQRYPIQEVHLEKDGAVVVIVGREGVALHLGQPPYRGKLEQADRVLSELAKRKAEASIVFLDNDASPERVVVRMR